GSSFWRSRLQLCCRAYCSVLRAYLFFFSSRRRHTRCYRDWSSDVCSSDLLVNQRYQTTLATQQAFFGALADEELVRVGQAQVQRARQQLQNSVNKFQAGAATRSDTLTSTVDLGTARLPLLQAQANLATAPAALGRQLGGD